MKKYFNSLTRRLTPADIFIFSVFAVFQFVLFWWFRKLFFITAFSTLLIYCIIYAVVFKVDLKLLLRSLDVVDLTAVLFVVALSVSSLLSEYKSFSLGIPDTQEGIIIYLFYLAAFILLRRVIHFEERHFYVFVAAGVVVSAVAVPVFFGVFRIFMPPAMLTTYTNINMFSQMLTMYFAANFLLSLRQSDCSMRVFHFLAEILFAFCIIICQCDGMIVFLTVFFMILPFIAKIDLAVIKRFVQLAAAVLFALAVYNIVSKYALPHAASVILQLAESIPYYITLPISIVLLSASFIIKSDKNKDFTQIFRWGIPTLLVVGVAVGFIFWKETILEYYDIYGGNRTVIITSVFSTYFKVFSPIEKLFGTGMYSFGSFLETYCPYLIPKIITRDLTIEFLYPHNFVMELIFETGAVGFFTCVAFLVSAIKNAARQKDEYSRIAFVSVILYLVTRLFYVPSPEITPIAMLFLAGCCPVLKKPPKSHIITVKDVEP